MSVLPGRRASVLLVAAASTALLGGGLITASAGNAATGATGSTASCGSMFDDFNYTSPTDSAFTAHGWSARSTSGGPGLAGAAWSAGNISFPTVDGQKVAQLSTSTDGTAAGTSQSEFAQTGLRFMDGTYASRIKFQDTPASGPDGDHVNETFFAIGPAQRYDYDPLYSELDFSEYLPNGGWGAQGPIDYETSWNGYRDDPWDPHNAHDSQVASLDGWHTVVSQVGGGHVKYYIDGTLVGDQTTDDATGTYPVTPRVPMTVNYNMWLIDNATHTGGTSTYHEDVDWFYYAKDKVLSPRAAVARAALYRATGTTHTDTLNARGCTDPTPPTTPPTAPPTAPPTTTPPTAPPTGPVNCSTAPDWSWSTTYPAGAQVKHHGHVWSANWWTLGSEPGLTAQWKDLGPC